MKVGDLIRYKDPNWNSWIGVIIRQIRGTERRQVVHWLSTGQCSEPNNDPNTVQNTNRTVFRSSHPARELEVINESR